MLNMKVWKLQSKYFTEIVSSWQLILTLENGGKRQLYLV